MKLFVLLERRRSHLLLGGQGCAKGNDELACLPTGQSALACWWQRAGAHSHKGFFGVDGYVLRCGRVAWVASRSRLDVAGARVG